MSKKPLLMKIKKLILFSMFATTLSMCSPEVEYFNNVEVTEIYSITEGEFLKIIFADQFSGFAITGHDIHNSSDRGLNWQKIASFPDLKLRDIDFADRLTGFILFDSEVHVTKDGGKTWELELKNGWAFRDLDILSTIHGYVLDERHLYYTSDGGINWSTIDLPAGMNPSGIVFFSTNRGFIFDNFNDEVHYTSDGGVSWTQKDISSVHFDIKKLNSDAALLSGDGMTILRSDGTSVKDPLDHRSTLTNWPNTNEQWLISGEYFLMETKDAGVTYEELFNQNGESIYFNDLWFIVGKGFGIYENKIYQIEFVK